MELVLVLALNMTQAYLLRANSASGRIGKYVQRSRECIGIFFFRKFGTPIIIGGHIPKTIPGEYWPDYF